MEPELCQRVMEYMVAEYRGSGDLEVFDAYDFVEYFEAKPKQSQGAHPRA